MSWLFGIGALAAVLAVGLRVSEARAVWSAAQGANLIWLVCAFALQTLTYAAQGQIFREVARAGDFSLRAATAYRISLTKLFFDQALPSAGLTGTAVAATELSRAGMSRPLLAASVVVSIASYQIAYAVSLLAALPVVAAHAAVGAWLSIGVIGIALAALLWSGVVLGLAGRRRVLPRIVTKLRLARELLDFVFAAQASIACSARLLALASAWQLMIIAADAATFWVLLIALGVSISPTTVFASFMLANVFRAIGLVPGGLGTFEGAAVLGLHVAGVSVTLALAATLLFRALSFWLPMPIGFYLYHRAYRTSLKDLHCHELAAPPQASRSEHTKDVLEGSAATELE